MKCSRARGEFAMDCKLADVKKKEKENEPKGNPMETALSLRPEVKVCAFAI